jgi:hypothetical protein
MLSPKKKRTESSEQMDTGEPKSSDVKDDSPATDPAIVRSVIQQLIPIFCVVFTVSFMLESISIRF